MSWDLTPAHQEKIDVKSKLVSQAGGRLITCGFCLLGCVFNAATRLDFAHVENKSKLVCLSLWDGIKERSFLWQVPSAMIFLAWDTPLRWDTAIPALKDSSYASTPSRPNFNNWLSRPWAVSAHLCWPPSSVVIYSRSKSHQVVSMVVLNWYKWLQNMQGRGGSDRRSAKRFAKRISSCGGTIIIINDVRREASREFSI